MDAPAQREDDRSDQAVEDHPTTVTCHETRPGKVVFTERNNSDGWIATDVAVDLAP